MSSDRSMYALLHALMGGIDLEFYEPGDIIYTGRSLAHVIREPFRKTFCNQCLRRNPNVKTCAKCHYVYYCNRECQKTGWADHKLECKRLNLLTSAKCHADSVLLIARVILKLKDKNSDSLKESVCSRIVTMDDVPALIRNNEEAMDLHIFEVLRVLQMFIGRENMPPIDEAVKICAKVIFNKCTMNDGDEFGWAFCIGTSVFQTSCLPNAVKLCYEGQICMVRATQRIRRNEINNIFVPFVAVLNSFSSQSRAWGYEFAHHKGLCKSCSPNESVLTKVLDKEKAGAIIARSQSVLSELEQLNGASHPQLSKRVYLCLEEHKGVLADTHILHLKLLAWRLLIHESKLYVVKKLHKGLLKSLKSVYGEKSYELIVVYNRLTCMFADEGSFKLAQQFEAKQNELNVIYGLGSTPNCRKSPHV